MADDVPDQGLPTESAGQEIRVEPVGRASEWSFEWRGLVSLVAIVVVAVIGWRVIGGDGSAAEDGADDGPGHDDHGTDGADGAHRRRDEAVPVR